MTSDQTAPQIPPTLSYLPVQQLPHARRFPSACWLLAAACFLSLLVFVVKSVLPFFISMIRTHPIYSSLFIIPTVLSLTDAALFLTALFLLFSAKPTHPAASPLPRLVLTFTSITLVLSIIARSSLSFLTSYSSLPPYIRPGSPSWLAITAWFLLNALLACILYTSALLFALQVARYLRLRWLTIASAIILGAITLGRLLALAITVIVDLLTFLNPPPASTGPTTYYHSLHSPILDALRKVILATNFADQLLFLALAITLILLALKLPRLAQPPS